MRRGDRNEIRFLFSSDSVYINCMKSLPWYQGSWGQHGVHLGPKGPRRAPRWPHELCYLGYCFPSVSYSLSQIPDQNNSMLPLYGWGRFKLQLSNSQWRLCLDQYVRSPTLTARYGPPFPFLPSLVVQLHRDTFIDRLAWVRAWKDNVNNSILFSDVIIRGQLIVNGSLVKPPLIIDYKWV